MSKDVQYLEDIATVISAMCPKDHGFIVFAVPIGDSEDRRLRYISDLKREDAVKILNEWLERATDEESWMKHLDG